MKRISAWFLALAMALSLVQVPSYASEVSAQDNAQTVEETEDVSASVDEEAMVSDETEESADVADDTDTVDDTDISDSTDVITEESDAELSVEEADSADDAEEDAFTAYEDTTYYVQMNIPYTDFYASEDVSEQIDAVSTATTNKYKGTTGLAKGTYNGDEKILGVTYPVAMDADTYAAVADNKVADDADLGTSASYAFKDLTTTPAAYKTLTYADGTYTFGEVSGETAKSADGLSVTELTTSGSYGNYQITLDGVKTAGTINDENVTIAGIVFTTSDGEKYPMYMLENIWLGTKVTNVEVAWSVYGAAEMKKNHGQSDEIFHQYMMNGKTITGIKLITDIGVYNMTTDVKLPILDVNNSLSVEDVNVLDGSTTFTSNLAFDNPTYSVNIDGATVEDGKITIPATTAPGTYTLTATDPTGDYAAVSTTFTVSAYALVNIPYAYFYKSDIKNDVDVDVFTSATKTKAANVGLAGNTYRTADNSEITGVTYPALISSTTGLTAVDAADIATAASWSYTLLSEKPNQYKVVTVTAGRGPSAATTYSVGAAVADVNEYTEADGITATLKTATNYGDYQLDFTGLIQGTDRQGNVTSDGKIPATDYVYGAIVATSEGNSYGMRALENIWKGELAWCTGFTTDVHGCPTSSAHYEAMMGQHISSVTFMTNSGIYTLKGLDIYVPVKSSEISVSVAASHVGDGKAVVTTSFPADYSPVYTVNMDGATVADGQITFPADVKNGSYTLSVSDSNGKYADTSATFEVKADKIPATYDSSKKALVKASDASDEDFAAYIAAISSVSVDGTSYAKVGFRGAAGTVIVKDDGSIDTTLDIFATAKVYSLTVPVTGYDELTFSLDQRTATTITAASTFTKTYGDAAFSIGAKASTGAALTYSSSNAAVATVSASGVVTIKKAGTAVITVSLAATDSTLAASKNITVTVNISATTITAASKFSKKYGNAAFSIGAKASSGAALTYKSSNTSVATVSAKGVVTIKKAGTAVITVTAAATENYQAASKNITVSVSKAAQPMKVKVSSKSYTVKTVKKKAQTFSIGVSKAAGKVTYSSNSKKVTVSAKGKVVVKKGTKKGTYKITVKAAGSTNYSAGSKTITIKVK